ncbi:phosphate signaling complex protein PhoU [Dolosicoccus paucivorans]|uniref:Phosphate-specific transport system accessory protein PhoU n=1 Tax=Dolosicoccus paucivorans TaxID=84521 RepID=A0A1G8LN09_9LACT|nr:phosphate signaling complex protein PhoU [Dolosicoccus paucivorans]PMB83866.1 phosphate transport system regulatory protein PhoU [Dolosicoccus paucivorans]PMC58079.1 phosphate transport system regulatory protein PhoU [Dolosicoccus paucivorans]SDI57066.1 phosphate transport system protein [Dolosicoccus paucivorans]
MRKTYVQELNQLHDNLILLTKKVNASILKSVDAFIKEDRELAHELFSDDLRINALAAEMEKDTYRIIALQQPVASDLRMIFTVIHASTDLERMGDHAVSIAKATLRRTEDTSESKTVTKLLKDMADLVTQMSADVLKAYMAKDASMAKQIASRDEQVDALLKEVYREARIRMSQKTGEEVVEMGLGYIGVANNLERIGDYITNICERIVFLNTGEIVELN